MRWIISVFVLLGLVGFSVAGEFRDFGVPQRLGKMKVDKKYWTMPADEAAVGLAKQFAKKGFMVKVEEKIKPIISGYMTYSGSSNYIGANDTLIQFGEAAVQYEVDFHNAYNGFLKDNYSKNLTHFTCTKSSVSDELSKACEIIQHFNGMKRTRAEDNYATSREHIHSNPPISFKSVRVFDPKGKRVNFRVGGVNTRSERDNILMGHEHTWASDYAEVVLRNAQELTKKSVKRASNVAAQRADLMKFIREIIGNEHVPISFLMVVIEGIDKACLHELENDLKQLSKRVSPVSEYVKEYRRLDHERKGRDYLELMKSKDQGDILYQKLRNRYFDDEVQQLRAKLDTAMLNLKAVGNEQKIGDLIDKEKEVGHLMYDIVFKDRLAFDRLSLHGLKRAETSYDHYKYIKEMLKAGRKGALFNFLEQANGKKFSMSCVSIVAEIRKRKPEWKERLLAGLISYIRESDAPRTWVLSAMEELMPADNPQYFDLKVVGECLLDPKVKAKLTKERIDALTELGEDLLPAIGTDTDKTRYEKLVSRWKKLSKDDK